MTDEPENSPEDEDLTEADADRLKNPSPVGTQHNPVSNPPETKNPMKDELDDREEFLRKLKEKEQSAE